MHGVPTAPYVEIHAVDFRKDPSILLRKIESYPVWIKPAHLGSSIGVSRATNPEEALKAAQIALSYDDTLIAEKEVLGIQIEYSLLGNEYIRIAKSAEILNLGFHDYKSKYGAAACGCAIPARISIRDQKIGEELALTMYRAAGCKGLARIDFFYDANGHFWMNEINPMPGFTPTSAYPMMWKESNMNLTQLCDNLLILSMHRQRRLSEVRSQ